jgi:RuvB-like protein 2
MQLYTLQIKSILKIRCEEEDVEIEDGALTLLTKIGMESSLRYAIHMITVSNLVCMRRKGTEVSKEDIKRVYSLFVDVKRSTEFLEQYQSLFMFSEVNDEEDDDDAEMET